ncbi:hypothetical protein BpHYR1_043285 [Brachionus plicatilis]|uniref:Uncharacterized protein n=1 Tax=Brachionus plicatilis TaxID=10195 RepID=A0A3M7PJH6_BRAPC|nr:hypothetical protein BpHYR1_043285 [Brachionus plicatilis]
MNNGSEINRNKTKYIKTVINELVNKSFKKSDIGLQCFGSRRNLCFCYISKAFQWRRQNLL